MPTEVWTTLIAALVGAAGVIATYFTARLGRDAVQREAAASRQHMESVRLRDERREAYVGFLQAVACARSDLHEIKRLANGERRFDDATGVPYRRAFQELRTTREPLRLVGSETVRRCALEVTNHTTQALTAARKGDRPKFDQRQLRKLLVAMKHDLGHELAEKDWPLLAEIEDGFDETADN